MKKILRSFSILIITVLILTAFSIPTAQAALDEKSLADNTKIKWTQDYIAEVPPIMMRDPLLEMFGQVDGAIPYTYEEAVKLAGHSCGAVAGGWEITRKALEVLYPDGEIPVRGQIYIYAPGAEDEWHVGVLAEVMMYITGAAPKSGFNGAEYKQANDVYARRNKLIFAETATKTPPPQMQWIFERYDNGKKVGVVYNVGAVQPATTPEWTALGIKLAYGLATPQETAEYVKWWNARAKFVFQNADTFVVTELN